MAGEDTKSVLDGELQKKKRAIPAAAIIALAALIFGSAAGFFLTPLLFGAKAGHGDGARADASNDKSAPASAADAHEAAPDGKKAKKSKNSDAGHGARESKSADCGADCADAFRIVGDSLFYAPEPFVVSIRPGTKSRRLKIAIAVETAPEAQPSFEDNSLRIKDALTIYLRAVDPGALENPDAFQDIRAQIARRVSAVVAPAPVRAILITEFILT